MADLYSHNRSTSARTVEMLYRFLVPLTLIMTIAAVFTDWAYARTATIQYSNASAWLLMFGLFAAGFAIFLLLLSFMGGWLDRRSLTISLVLFVVGFVVEIINFMIHNRDGWTTVVPSGITLSVIGALILIAAAWFGRTPVTLGRRA